MTAPRRFLDDDNCSPALRELLASAPKAKAMPVAVQARLAAYSTHLAAGTASAALLGSAGSHTAAQSSLWGKAVVTFAAANLGTKVVLGVAVFAGFVATGYVASAPLLESTSLGSLPQRVPSSPAVPRIRAVSPSAKPEGATEPLMPSTGADVREPLSVSVPARTEAVAARELGPHAAASSAAVEPIDLAKEARMLEAARASLVANPAQALEITREHAQLFPSGQLYAERELIAIDALLRLGRRREAVGRAAPRLEQAKDSLYAKRLRQLLGDTAP